RPGFSSATTCQAEFAAPALQESLAQPTVSVILELRIGGDDPLRFDACILEDRGVTQEIGDPELRQPRLAGTKELSGSAERKVGLGDPESVVGLRHRLDPALGVLGELAGVKEDAVRLPRPAADPAAELVGLGGAKGPGWPVQLKGGIEPADPHPVPGGGAETGSRPAFEAPIARFFP